MSPKWTAADVPDQTGRVALVTGANAGLGLETAAVLEPRRLRDGSGERIDQPSPAVAPTPEN